MKREQDTECWPDSLLRMFRPLRPRKVHGCRLCNTPIDVGVPCCSWTTFDDGPETWYAHAECYWLTEVERWGCMEWESTLPGDVER